MASRSVGIVQRLIASSQLQGLDPYVYVVDMLLRIATHFAFDVQLFTPQLWKQHFVNNLLRLDLDHLRQ